MLENWTKTTNLFLNSLEGILNLNWIYACITTKQSTKHNISEQEIDKQINKHELGKQTKIWLWTIDDDKLKKHKKLTR